jgi:protein TonB
MLEHDEHLERALAGEPVAAPMTGSVLLHLGLAGLVVAYSIAGGFIHSNLWGGATAGGAMRVELVSNALPLPADEPPNQNVLTTDKPSPAPAPPAPKTVAKVDQDAIAIKSLQQQKKPEPEARVQQKFQQPVPQNRAQYGEQAGNNIPKAITGQTVTNGPVTVSTGDFGTRFAWYVDVIRRKVDQNWYRPEVDPRTPKGAKVTIYFKIDRRGGISGWRVARSSGSPTLDSSCLRATQRVDAFPTLPAEANDAWLDVTYDCTY